jgi:hypothetical protein
MVNKPLLGRRPPKIPLRDPENPPPGPVIPPRPRGGPEIPPGGGPGPVIPPLRGAESPGGLYLSA